MQPLPQLRLNHSWLSVMGFWVFCLTVVCVSVLFYRQAQAQELSDAPYAGMSLSEALDKIQGNGLPLVYSSSLIRPEMTVQETPASTDPLAVTREILSPHGLEVQQMETVYLVVRSHALPDTQASAGMILLLFEDKVPATDHDVITIHTQPALAAPGRVIPELYQFNDVPPGNYRFSIEVPGFQTIDRSVSIQGSEVELVKLQLSLVPAQLEDLNISASRYVLVANSQFFIDQSAIQALPDLGEDPIRSVHRLPGTAAGGLSARSHFRGGENDENAIYFNGIRLTDPFHIRDYHSIFSSIDARAISGVEAYTGGFPARYGDQMSGVVLLESRRPDQPRHTELGLSIYNTSLLHSGYSSDGRWEWLGSARRSNLGILLSSDLGKPDYFDIFGELAINLNSDTRLSFNALYADDQVVVITESDPSELETSTSKTRNGHAWARLEQQWTASLGSDTSLWFSNLDNRRDAVVNDPEKMVASVSDQRDISIFGISSNWSFHPGNNHQLRWGFEWSHQSADYDYRSQVEYFGFAASWPDLENPRASHIIAQPGGDQYGVFVADRWRLNDRHSVDLGLRWDQQDYASKNWSAQISPRISTMHRISENTELRLTWGRYHQSQAIQRLQVEDGIDEFFAPQRADHVIAGLRYRLPSGYRFRFEFFQKNYDRLKPRFENLFDSLVLIPELAPDRVRLEPSAAQSRGVELSMEYRGNRELEWWASYSLARATDRIDGVDEPRSWDQTHAVQAGLAWKQAPWEIGLAVNWHSGWPTTDMTLAYDEEEDEYFPVPGPRNRERLKNYSTLDFRISREFSVKKGRLSAFFEVSNATNRDNICCIDYDTEEDDEGNIFLDRSVDKWLPLLPAIGLFWEF